MEKQSRQRLTASDLEQVRSAVDWKELFDGLGLKRCEKKSKAEDWWVFSPFHEEREPSFHMGPGGIWYDFSIGVGGGALELVQRLQGVNCYEAAHYLIDNGWSRFAAASHASDEAETTRKRASQAIEPGQKSNPPIRQDLLPLTSYHEYLAERGLSEETCEKLGVGFLGQGRSPLRGRIIFQLRDAQCLSKSDKDHATVILSHFGRALDDECKPKYLFYEGFQKSLELLGQDRCWCDAASVEQIKQLGVLIITEGPFDWAKAIEAGLLNVVACMGAHLSPEQTAKIKAICQSHGIDRVLVAFDRDRAGQSAAEAAISQLQSAGLDASKFDWERPLDKRNGKPRLIPATIEDLADLTVEQLAWLRRVGRL